MNRLAFPLMTTLAVLCFQFATSAPTGAQTKYAELCRAEMKSAAGEPAQFLLAKLKLTDALADHDLSQALANGKQALEFAEGLGDANATTLANLQIMSIRSLRESKKSTGFDPTQYELTADATPEQRMLFYSTLINSKLWDHAPTDCSLEFYLAAQAAAECPDSHLAARLDSLEVFYRLTWLGDSPDHSELTAIAARLEEHAQSFPFLDNQIALHLLQSERRNLAGDIEQMHRNLQLASSAASRLGNRKFEALCYLQSGNAFLQQERLELSQQFFLRSLEAAKQLQIQPHFQLCCRKLAKVHRQRNESTLAKKYLEMALASPAFEDQAFLVKNGLKEGLLTINLHQGDAREINRYQNEIIALDAKQEIREQERTRTEMAAQAAQARILALEKQQRLQQEFDSEKSASAAVISTLWRYSIVATLVGLLLLAFTALSRLKKVSGELDTEKAHVRQSQQELDALALRLNRMQRMESLGLMAGSVAHDFNNILVGVLGNAEIIQMSKGVKDEEFVDRRIASIITSAEKATSLSRQMLAYSGKQTIARSATNLNALIRQYESVIQSACADQQTLTIELSPSKLVSKIDPVQIEQVVLNLVTNAVEATSASGKITVRTGTESIREVDPTLHGDRTTGGEFNYIEVQDDGCGIPAAEIERIFEPFYSNSDAGRGLGLAVVYGVLKGHDGFVQCRSRQGQGTHFRVLLPMSDEPELELEAPLKSTTAVDFGRVEASSRTQTVLVIDDEDSVLDLCRQLFQLIGWNVLTAVGGRQGVELAKQRAGDIACVLLDVVMPDMGANEVLSEFEKHQLNVPTVIMSGFSQSKLEFFLDRPNVMSIVQKPFHAMEIQQAVKEAALSPSENFPSSALDNSFNFRQHAK